MDLLSKHKVSSEQIAKFNQTKDKTKKDDSLISENCNQRCTSEPLM